MLKYDRLPLLCGCDVRDRGMEIRIALIALSTGSLDALGLQELGRIITQAIQKSRWQFEDAFIISPQRIKTQKDHP